MVASNESKSFWVLPIVVAILVTAVATWFFTQSDNHPQQKKNETASNPNPTTIEKPSAHQKLPRLLDLGSITCIPCKMMAPILEELKKDFDGKMAVEFVDVYKDKATAEKYGIETIPTQIFFAANGDELFRHVGFMSRNELLAKWKELGFDFEKKEKSADLTRAEPLVKDSRPPDQSCGMCEKTINAQTRATVNAPTGRVELCSPHCFFIYFSSLRDPESVVGTVLMTDWNSGKPLAADKAFYCRSFDKNERPVVKAFAENASASVAAEKTKGKVLDWAELSKSEMDIRCAFCDRCVYESDATLVSTLTPRQGGGCCGTAPLKEDFYACCPMCALGVAAHTKKDIFVEQKDALTGDWIKVMTEAFTYVHLDPPTAVAWHGQRKNTEGKMTSAGCFHQFFFTCEENLRKWLEKNPDETGRMITIKQAFQDKMNMTQTQIENACKIGECKPQ